MGRAKAFSRAGPQSWSIGPLAKAFLRRPLLYGVPNLVNSPFTRFPGKHPASITSTTRCSSTSTSNFYHRRWYASNADMQYGPTKSPSIWRGKATYGVKRDEISMIREELEGHHLATRDSFEFPLSMNGAIRELMPGKGSCIACRYGEVAAMYATCTRHDVIRKPLHGQPRTQLDKKAEAKSGRPTKAEQEAAGDGAREDDAARNSIPAVL